MTPESHPVRLRPPKLLCVLAALLMAVAVLLSAPPTTAQAEKITDVYSNGILSGGLANPFYVYLNAGETLYAKIEAAGLGNQAAMYGCAYEALRLRDEQ